MPDKIQYFFPWQAVPPGSKAKEFESTRSLASPAKISSINQAFTPTGEAKKITRTSPKFILGRNLGYIQLGIYT
jgi:hypothetical protein